MAKKKTAKAAPAEKAEKAAKPAKEKKAPKVRAPGNFLGSSLPILAAVVLVLAGLQLGAWHMVSKAESARRAEIAQALSEHYVAMLTSYVRGYEQVVKATPDAELLAYVPPEQTTSQDVLGHYPGALLARVSPLAIDPAAPNGLSFSQQDMVQRLAAGRVVNPEISFVDNGQIKSQVVTFARLLKDGQGKPAGALLLGFSFEPLANALKTFAPEAGTVELVQKVGAEKASILKAGEEGEAGAEVMGTTSNPAWELHFTPAHSLGRSNETSPLLLVLAIVAPLLAGGALALVVLRLQKRAKEDLLAIDSSCENLFLYGNRQRPALHFSDTTELMKSLERYGSESRAAGRGSRTAHPADELDSLAMGDMDSSALFGEGSGGRGAPARAPAAPAPAAPPAPAAAGVAPEIFRAYDIRGVVGKALTPAVAKLLGQAIGSEAGARGEQTVVVGRDGRLSGPELAGALIEGLRASGRDVIDVGMVPTPVLYFAAKTIGTGSGVMVTGSHNPSDYNGFKIMIAGDTLAGDDIQGLRQRIETRNFTAGGGALTQSNVASDYIDRVSGDIALARPLNVVVDAGNGAAGPIGVRVLEAMGCHVTPLYCEVDGNFPNHHPDPSKPENLEDLINSVHANNADIGIAFDGDGDRIGVVTSAGKMIFPDRLMMLYAKHVLTTNPGADIIFDVKCTRDLRSLITQAGGRPVMCKTGHSFIKAKLKETGALLAGEMSGHIFFNDRWFGFDDAVYSAARLLEILSLEAGSSDEVFAEFPENPATPEINIPVADDRKFGLMDQLAAQASFPDANVITIDGVRVEFASGWGLVRASNTTPCLVARFEGRTPEALAEVQSRFRSLLNGVDSSLQVPF